MSLIEIKDMSKEYGNGELSTMALKNVSFKANEGEMISIMGPSGSGKTTLLNILGCLDIPTSGEYYLAGHNVKTLRKKQIAEIRNKKIGFIFQQFALIPEYTIIENVEMPLLYRNSFESITNQISRSQRHTLASESLESVGLGNFLKKTPNLLSGGQQQRVAIARALVSNPDIILADEPTGSLDQKTGSEIMKLLSNINKQGKLVIIVTHDTKIASFCQRVIQVIDGKVSETTLV
jgi:putative ABC transport system ATP-binding protein